MHATEIKTVEGKDISAIPPNEPIPVAFNGPQDPENPQGWSAVKRWRVLLIALTVSYTSAFNASSYGATSAGFRKEHTGVSSDLYQLGGAAFLIMLGIGPLVLAPVSETFGRRPMLASLTLLITLLFLPQALAPNVTSIIVTRFIQGTAACIEGPVAAGVVADLTTKGNRGIMMGSFVLCIFTANATGPLTMNWVSQFYSWRLVFWIQMASNGACWLMCLLFFPETRSDVILAKRAKALAASTGRPHFVTGLDTGGSWIEAFKISCTRPLLYLTTEPIVTALALWVGFAWGTVFLLIGAITHVFSETYGFSKGQAATVLITGFLGAVLGWTWNATVQEHWYKKAMIAGGGKAQPEVRLYSSALGGILFALGCFGFAGTARESIHWIVPCIFITIAQMGIYQIYNATYTYLGDAYERFSSSAQAAQSLLRNILGGCFPFFALDLYDNLGFTAASSLVGGIAAGFALVPFFVIIYGARLRARSSIAMAMELEGGNVLPEEPETVQVV